MAIDFNGTTSRLVNTTADLQVTTLVTICAWVLPDNAGEGSAGFVIALDENESIFSINKASGLNKLRFFANWTGTDGQWDFPIVDGQWNAVAVAYDGGATTNDPVARVGFQDATVTQVGGDPTTAFGTGTGYCIGNRNNQNQTWDGGLAHVQVFNVLLTAKEMDQALRRPGSVVRGRNLWVRMKDADDLVDFSGNGFNGTGTDLSTRATSPPIPVPPGSRRTVVQHHNVDTAAAEVNATIVNKHLLVGPDGTEPNRFVIERIQWNVFGAGTITLSFDHTADDIVAVLTGAGDLWYPDGGIVDPASGGGTGNLLLSSSAVVGGSYDITITIRLKD